MSIISVILCFFLYGCATNNTDSQMNIELSISPSSAADTSYSINISGDSLRVRKLFGNRTICDSSIILSAAQIEKIAQHSKNVKTKNDVDEKAFMGFDTWVFKLSVNGKCAQLIDKVTLINSNANSDIRNLKEMIDFLISIAPIEIDLHGFS